MSVAIEQMAKLLPPPPDGSTATHTSQTCSCQLRSKLSRLDGSMKRVTSELANALMDESAATPIDSRSSIDGSSLKSSRTTSILLLDSHLGI
jgi:hypothetical protein